MQTVQLIPCTSMPMYLSMGVLWGGGLGLHCTLYPVRPLLARVCLCAGAEQCGDGNDDHP